MYACICHGVTEREVARHVASGADSLDAVADRCRAGTGCGSCLEHLDDLLQRNRATEKCGLAAMSA